MREADKRFFENKKTFKIRQEVIEHIFGTVKFYLGVPQFYLRTKRKVEAEVSMLFLAYNLKRATNILGFQGLMAKLKERTRLFSSFFECFCKLLFSNELKSFFHLINLISFKISYVQTLYFRQPVVPILILSY